MHRLILLSAAILAPLQAAAVESQCHGTVSRGRIEGSVKLPLSGPNFSAYSTRRTHQNGLSVDFFVPVRDGTGRSVPLPTNLTDKWGYDIEFNQEARYGDYTIDFEALADHLYQLGVAARAAGSRLALVIFDSPVPAALVRHAARRLPPGESALHEGQALGPAR